VFGFYSTTAVFWIVLGIPILLGLIALGALLTRKGDDG
jgi:hypothetical protein